MLSPLFREALICSLPSTRPCLLPWAREDGSSVCRPPSHLGSSGAADEEGKTWPLGCGSPQ